MGLVSRPRALHIKNIQMPLPPGERAREREREREREGRKSAATRGRIYGLHGAIVQIMFMKQCRAGVVPCFPHRSPSSAVYHGRAAYNTRRTLSRWSGTCADS